MKNLKYILALTLSAAAVVSCQENADMAAIEMPAQGEDIILTATAPSAPSTRIVETIGATGVSFQWFGGDTWNAPDKLTVYNADNGERVGDFMMKERGVNKASATFEAIGVNMVAGSDAEKKDIQFDEPTFTLSSGVNYIAVFPATGAATLDARDAEELNGLFQYQNATGGWRTGMRLRSAEFTTDNPTLTFTHETALMSIDFLSGGAFPTNLTCNDGVHTASLQIADLYKEALKSQYTAKFVMYPSTSDKLTFTITTADGDTEVVRNIGAEIKAGYYYNQSLIESVITPTTTELIADGGFETGKAGDVPGVNEFACNWGYTGAWLATGGVDDSACGQCTIISSGPGNLSHKLPFNELSPSAVSGSVYYFSIDMKCTMDATISADFQVGGYNSGGSVVFDDSTLVAGADWKTLSGYVTSSASTNVFRILTGAIPANAVLLYDNASLVLCEAEFTMPLEN